MITNSYAVPTPLAMVSLMRDCDVLLSGPFDQCAEACYYQISVYDSLHSVNYVSHLFIVRLVCRENIDKGRLFMD